jgi:hypothetical protein
VSILLGIKLLDQLGRLPVRELAIPKLQRYPASTRCDSGAL